MNIKGACYFSKLHNEHIIVIISDTDEYNKALIVPLSSIKFIKDGKSMYNNLKCSPYDTACTLDIGDIVSDKNINVITKPTYALYKRAEEIDINLINTSQWKGALEYRCMVSREILEKLQNGAKVSDYLQERFYKYFDFF